MVWATVVTSGDAQDNPPAPGALYAFDAENLSHELWDSTQNPARDGFGNFGKFVPPLVANGKVYVATWSNQVAVYGLLTSSFTQPRARARRRWWPGIRRATPPALRRWAASVGTVTLSVSGLPAGAVGITRRRR